MYERTSSASPETGRGPCSAHQSRCKVKRADEGVARDVAAGCRGQMLRSLGRARSHALVGCWDVEDWLGSDAAIFSGSEDSGPSGVVRRPRTPLGGGLAAGRGNGR